MEGYVQEFESGYIIFESDYANREGKEYYYKNNLIENKINYINNYLNGKKNEKEKEFIKYNNLIYEGEYSNNKRIEKETNLIILIKKNNIIWYIWRWIFKW